MNSLNRPFYPSKTRTDFVTRSGGLRVIGESTNIAKLAAMSFEKRPKQPGFPLRAKYVSKIIKKGPWRGMPLFVLTLPERQTCPSCPIKKTCYGRHMPHAIRMDPKAAGFQTALRTDLTLLAKRYPAGFVVRLHELGDFYSPGYVRIWEKHLARFSGLHVFGYSHQSGQIGNELDRVQTANPERFRIMDSDSSHGTGRPTANVIGTVSDAIPSQGVVCPQQIGLTPSCNTCGLCMNNRTSVQFITH